MDNSREPNRNRLRSITDDQENTPPSTMSKAASDGHLSFFKSEFEKKLKDMGILEHKLQESQKHAAELENENVQMKEIIEKQKAEEKKSLEPLVLKKLFKLKEGNLWHGYKTLNENEEPIVICMIDSKNLLINGVIFGPVKKLVLDGLLSTFDADPFEGNAGSFEENDEIISNLLKKVNFCDLTDLCVAEQYLSLSEFEKLVSSGTIKNFYFDYGCIRDDKDDIITFENILQKLPNVEKFEMDGTLTKGSFKTLNKLVPFKKLQVFKLTSIDYGDFDRHSFSVFMKNHPNTRFTLSFLVKSRQKAELEAIKKKILDGCPTPGKLEVKFQ